MRTIKPEVVELLACPRPDCRGKLNLQEDRLVCAKCGLRYRIEEGWPVLIPEEAEPPAQPPGNGSV